ncbi:hypothetical protein SKAU_G00216190 [Synaphobranchus kaupii]|uniref:Uncharacterized protein n=1 Tax=Synaphobranchus kaupii TaxID=118154 RepID=A0A9Q1FA55_SYNKA|nr:hypothetical protein SKAU_G00216190 [Synaphobranchus kaupii]
MSRNKCAKLVASFPRRLEAVIAAKAILSKLVGLPEVESASSSHLFSKGLSLHMFLKLSCRASNLQIVVWEKTGRRIFVGVFVVVLMLLVLKLGGLVSMVTEMRTVMVFVRVSEGVMVHSLSAARNQAVHTEARLGVNEALSVRGCHARYVRSRCRSPCPSILVGPMRLVRQMRRSRLVLQTAGVVQLVSAALHRGFYVLIAKGTGGPRSPLSVVCASRYTVACCMLPGSECTMDELEASPMLLAKWTQQRAPELRLAEQFIGYTRLTDVVAPNNCLFIGRWRFFTNPIHSLQQYSEVCSVSKRDKHDGSRKRHRRLKEVIHRNR